MNKIQNPDEIEVVEENWNEMTLYRHQINGIANYNSNRTDRTPTKEEMRNCCKVK